MKLYTEEQVKEAIKMADKHHYLLDDEEDGIISLLTPIELPSDEEIRVQAVMYSNKWEEYRAGAKWIKQQILNQNK